MAYFTKFIKGSDVTIKAKLIDINTGENFDISSLTGCTGFFEKDDGDCIGVTGTVIDVDKSEVQFHIEDSDSALLKAGELVSYEIETDRGTDRTVHIMNESLEITDSIC